MLRRTSDHGRNWRDTYGGVLGNSYIATYKIVHLFSAKHPDRCEPRGAYNTCIDRLPYDAAAFYRFLTRTVVRPYKAAEDQLAPQLDEDPAKLMVR